MKGKTTLSLTVKRMILLLIPIAAGFAVALQNVFYDNISKYAGIMGTVLIVHVFGLIFAASFFIFTKYSLNDIVQNINWYMILSGLLGVIVVSGITKSVGMNGLLITIMITVTSQMFLGKVIAHFGWFGVEVNPINWLQVLAIFIMISGIFLYQKS
jgi:transporter family-2 protein